MPSSSQSSSQLPSDAETVPSRPPTRLSLNGSDGSHSRHDAPSAAASALDARVQLGSTSATSLRLPSLLDNPPNPSEDSFHSTSTSKFSPLRPLTSLTDPRNVVAQLGAPAENLGDVAKSGDEEEPKAASKAPRRLPRKDSLRRSRDTHGRPAITARPSSSWPSLHSSKHDSISAVTAALQPPCTVLQKRQDPVSFEGHASAQQEHASVQQEQGSNAGYDPFTGDHNFGLFPIDATLAGSSSTDLGSVGNHTIPVGVPLTVTFGVPSGTPADQAEAMISTHLSELNGPPSFRKSTNRALPDGEHARRRTSFFPRRKLEISRPTLVGASTARRDTIPIVKLEEDNSDNMFMHRGELSEISSPTLVATSNVRRDTIPIVILGEGQNDGEDIHNGRRNSEPQSEIGLVKRLRLLRQAISISPKLKSVGETSTEKGDSQPESSRSGTWSAGPQPGPSILYPTDTGSSQSPNSRATGALPPWASPTQPDGLQKLFSSSASASSSSSSRQQSSGKITPQTQSGTLAYAFPSEGDHKWITPERDKELVDADNAEIDRLKRMMGAVTTVEKRFLHEIVKPPAALSAKPGLQPPSFPAPAGLGLFSLTGLFSSTDSLFSNSNSQDSLHVGASQSASANDSQDNNSEGEAEVIAALFAKKRSAIAESSVTLPSSSLKRVGASPSGRANDSDDNISEGEAEVLISLFTKKQSVTAAESAQTLSSQSNDRSSSFQREATEDGVSDGEAEVIAALFGMKPPLKTSAERVVRPPPTELKGALPDGSANMLSLNASSRNSKSRSSSLRARDRHSRTKEKQRQDVNVRLESKATITPSDGNRGPPSSASQLNSLFQDRGASTAEQPAVLGSKEFAYETRQPKRVGSLPDPTSHDYNTAGRKVSGDLLELELSTGNAFGDTASQIVDKGKSQSSAEHATLSSNAIPEARSSYPTLYDVADDDCRKEDRSYGSVLDMAYYWSTATESDVLSQQRSPVRTADRLASFAIIRKPPTASTFPSEHEPSGKSSSVTTQGPDLSDLLEYMMHDLDLAGQSRTGG